MEQRNQLRTWIEVDTRALGANLSAFRALIGPKCRFMAVVKSNAYGHGIAGTAQALRRLAPSMWFGVDSLVEGLRLRREGIKNPILVLGATLPALYPDAHKKRIAVTVSNFNALAAFVCAREKPAVHIKIDTGMHRQGFFQEDVKRVIRELTRGGVRPEGIYTHFAAAKDRAYPTATLEQFSKFQKVVRGFHRAGFSGVLRHAAATGATILFPETHLDMVRVGIGLWGHWPSEEARMNVYSGKFGLPKIRLRPALSWKTVVVEVKKIPAGALVGYDFTDRVSRPSVVVVLPVGYWHGIDRGLSSRGSVLIRGKRARIIGRVSMDMVVCDVTGIAGVVAGDTAVLIGKQGKEEISAEEIARLIDTSSYEVLTRINPLIKRIYR